MANLLILARWQMIEYTGAPFTAFLVECKTCKERAINGSTIVNDNLRCYLTNARWAKVGGNRERFLDGGKIGSLKVRRNFRLATHEEREIGFPSPRRWDTGRAQFGVSKCLLEKLIFVHF